MKLATLDFETYYDREYSLSKLTTEEYLRDPRYETIGVSVVEDGAAPEWITGTETYIKNELRKFKLDHKAVCAHNTMFDGAILSWHFDIHPAFLIDTMSMARPHHAYNCGVSLAALAEWYNLGKKGTEVVSALGKRRVHFTADELAAYGGYCINDAVLTRKLLTCLQAKTPRLELHMIDATLRMFTEPVFELDHGLLVQHLSHVKAAKNEAVRAALMGAAKNPAYLAQLAEARLKGKTIKDILMSNPMFAGALEALGVEPPMKISAKTQQPAYAFAKTDKEFTDLEEHENPAVQALVAARLGAKSTLEESRTERFIGIAKRGPFPVALNYGGAFVTLRWSGGEKTNAQNMTRGSKLRDSLRAPKGHVIVVGDSANIELRVNHTLAGQSDTVAALVDGRDLYCLAASELYRQPVIKSSKLGVGASAADVKWHDDARFLGKLMMLSLGYGAGAEKFMHICRQKGVHMTPERAKEIVYLWRELYSRIPAFWKSGDHALAAIGRGEEYQVDTCGLVFTYEGGLRTKPNHRINYPGLEHDANDGWIYYKRNRAPVYMWGGKVVENICQHISRNIIAEQWAKIASRRLPDGTRYRVILQAHDELVLCVREQYADEARATLMQALCTAPQWWSDVPLSAEVGVGYTYGEAK